jgi:hypothetical protein
MNVTMFNELTTDDYLKELTAESETYIGIDADLNIAKQRKYIKDKAATIKGIIKAIDAARIKKSKDYRCLVEAEAVRIITILEKANEPFTLLIDDYDAERRKVLADEKAEKLAIEKAVQKEIDHEYAILLDKSYLADKMEAERIQLEHDENIRLMAVERAEEAMRSKIAYEKDLADRQEKARLADVEHVRHINRLILKEMHGHGLPEKESIEFIKTIARKKISQLTINY